MRDSFQMMAREIGELASEVKSLASKQEDSKLHGDRLTALETEMRVTKEWLENARVNSRWLIALCVGVIASALGLVITHWKP